MIAPESLPAGAASGNCSLSGVRVIRVGIGGAFRRRLALGRDN